MNHKQTIFWSVAGAIAAAIVGAVLTKWLTTSPSSSQGSLIFWQSVEELPEEACKAIFSSDTLSCSMYILNLKNDEIKDLGAFQVDVDFRDAVGRPLVSEETLAPPDSYPFVKGEVRVGSNDDFIRTLEFDRFPPFGDAQARTVIEGTLTSQIKVRSAGVNLVDAVALADEGSSGQSFFWFFIGLLVLPFIGLAIAFFQWLNKAGAKDG